MLKIFFFLIILFLLPLYSQDFFDSVEDQSDSDFSAEVNGFVRGAFFVGYKTDEDKLEQKSGYGELGLKGKNRDVYILETLADFLDFKFDPLSLKTNQEMIAYTKGFFDAEGGIPAAVRPHAGRREAALPRPLREGLRPVGVRAAQEGGQAARSEGGGSGGQ